MTSSRPVPNLAVLRRTIPSWQAERTRLVRIDLESGDAETVSKNHLDAFGLAISADETTACVTERGSGSLVAIDLAKRTRRVVVSGLDCPGGCTWLDESQGLLAAIEEGSGALAIIDVYSGAVRRVPGCPGQPGMPAVVGDLLIVASGQVVVAVPAENVLPKQIVLVPPADAIYRGGYARVSVDMGSSGVSFDDVNFRIAEGNEFAAISPSRDGTFDPARPHTMLLAGPVAGVYTLEARDPSGALLAQASFAVTDRWTHTDGPPMAFTGANPLYATGGTWGALFNGVWPNVFTYGPGAVTGTRRVALIFVNTADTVLPGGTDMLYRNPL